MSFAERHEEYRARIERVLDDILPDTNLPPTRLHEAMRYSVLNGGKRIRPLLVYATGEALGVDPECLDAPAAAIELMHSFSLVHDDLPAMDDDDLRRGKPTAHKQFDEATAILAADALQPLAFETLVDWPALRDHPRAQADLTRILASACGSNGMTGGQAIDIEAEGKQLDRASLEHMFRLKTGRLLRACVLSAASCPPGTDIDTINVLERYIDAVGLAFQIRDDILDIESSTEELGKQQGADIARDKATYPAMFGMDDANARVEELRQSAQEALAGLDIETESLQWVADLIVMRTY